jgi:hypothetical protein
MNPHLVGAICGAITGLATSMAMTFGTLTEMYPNNVIWVILGGLCIGISTGAGMFAAALRPREDPPVIGERR